MSQNAAPSLDELLARSPSNWGKWGPDDEVGGLNYLGPEQVVAASALIRSGKVFTIQRLIGDPKGDPVWPGRTPAVRTQIMDEATWDSKDAPQFPGGLHYADDKIDAFLQGSTQYDALGHVWYGGKIWNGYDARTTVGGMDRASVEPIARRGVVGRGVLLDMARFRGKKNLDTAETFSHEDLLACAAHQGVELRKRDIPLIRTNYLQLFFDLGDKFYDGFCEPGLVYSPELVD
ncbi:cyclase family protein [Streptomyces sp. NPDC002643]